LSGREVLTLLALANLDRQVLEGFVDDLKVAVEQLARDE
jgi:hypothetical protein